MKLNLMSLGDYITDPITGELPTAAERHRMIVEAAVVAEDAGFDGVNIGEHHGLEYIYSSPPVVLAAIAERTSTLRLGTAVTLMANLDALRAAEDYATLDVLSEGRVDIVAGRGNFFASTYTLFGQHIDESRERFDEGVELLRPALDVAGRVEWNGQFRPPINGEELQPQPVQRAAPIWIGGGSSPETAELAARLGFKLMLPSAFGNPAVFKPVAEAYRESYRGAGHDDRSRGGWVLARERGAHESSGEGPLGAAVPALPRVDDRPAHRRQPGVAQAHEAVRLRVAAEQRPSDRRKPGGGGRPDQRALARCSARPRTCSTSRWVACLRTSCSRWSN